MALCREPIEVLTAARLRGVRWNPEWCRVAGERNNLQLLQWLHKNGCPWVFIDVAAVAVYTGCVDTLNWLHSVEPEWSDSLKQRLLYKACLENNTSSATWLREQRAEWPS